MKKDEKDSVDDIIEKLNKQFGEGSIVKLGDTKIAKVDVIPTGSFSLDMALGVGGIPRGRITEIFGPESGGKTTLALSIIAQAQSLGENAAFIDAENSLDLDYAQRIGVNVKDLPISQPNSGEDALNIAVKLIESGKFAVIVVDSVAALEPKVESDADIGNQTMGLKARLMSQAMRKLAPAARRTNTALVFINQIRMKIGTQSWGNPETTPGGLALKFHTSVRIDIRRISTIKEGEESVGIEVKAKVSKNKLAPPFRVATFYLMFGEGISYETDVFNLAVEKGVIEKTGNTFFFGKEKLGVGMKNATKHLKSNKEIVEKIAEKLKGSKQETKQDDQERT